MRHFCKLLCISLLAANTTAAEIYTWKDKDGVTHFSEDKPAYEANISELELSPVSATVEDTTPAEAPAVAEQEEPAVEKQVKRQEAYQAPETATDKLLFNDRMVDRTDSAIGNDDYLEGRIIDRGDVSIGDDDNLKEKVVDRLNKPRLNNALVDEKKVSIRAAVKE